MSDRPSLVWFRRDLRLSDHPALDAAAARGPVIPVHVWDPDEHGRWPPGAASRWWLHHSLSRLDEALRARGSRLVLRRGSALRALRDLARETGATRVTWHRAVEPDCAARDARVAEQLRGDGLEVEVLEGSLLVEPSEIRTGAGGPFKVFTPFWRALLAGPRVPEPLPTPRALSGPARWPRGETLASFALLPRVPWDEGLRAAWTPGEEGALARLEEFAARRMRAYSERRDEPGCEGTSRLSPHLAWGEISPRQAWAHARRAARAEPADPWLRQLVWREFAHHCLHHFPHAPDAPLRAEFARFPWRRDATLRTAWERGLTGYPIVDAGMRELWTTGWMHNRVRMVVASFLVKHLLQPWQDGERWFWDTLVDADLANNALSWQWVAGCGLDAAPYFRIFNPVTQGEKFDPRGAYVRRWVPEIAGLPDRHLHAPWTAPPLVLAAAGVVLGGTYPRPIVDHAEARARALAALARVREARGAGP